MKITGYKEVAYCKFMEELNKCYLEYEETEKDIFKLAGKLELKSIYTITNFLKSELQSVSDKRLTLMMELIGFKGFILWEGGKRYYYTSC